MSGDIASLGLRIDSTQAKTAATDLDRLQASAGGAAAATDKLATSSGKSGSAAKGLAGAAAPAAKAATDLAKAGNAAAESHRGMSTQAMAAQHSIRSLVEAMASGQPITMALGQQLNHLSYAATGPGGITAAFKQAAGSLLSLASPTALVAVGIGAVAAVTVLAVHNLAETAKKFDDVAHSAGTSTERLRDFATAASFKGIDNGEFLKGMEKFASSVYEAQHNMGGLGDVMRANGATAKTFDDYLEKAADLIKNAATDQARLQILQQMGLPATMQWVRFLSQGKDGIREAIKEAANFNSSAEGQLIAKARQFDEAWDKATTNLGRYLRNAVLSGATLLDTLGEKATGLLMRLPGIGASVPTNVLRKAMEDNAAGLSGVGSRLRNTSDTADFYKGLGTAAPGNGVNKTTNDPNVLKDQISKEQQAIGIRSSLLSVSDAVRAKELEINAARLAGVKVSSDEAAAIIAVTKAQAEQSRVNQQASVGIFDLAKAQQAANDNLKALVAQGLLDPNNPKQYAAATTSAAKSLEQLSDQAAVAGSKFEQLKRYQLDAANSRTAFDGFATRTLDSFTNGLADAVTGVKSWKDATVDALRTVAQELAKLATRSLITGPLAGLLGGIGGFGGGIGPILGGPSGHVPGFASGTDFAPGGMSLVGEHGPELVRMPTGAKVYNTNQTRGLMSGGGGVTIGDTHIAIHGNADDYGISQLRGELARHRKMIGAIVSGNDRQQRFAATGVA